MNNPLIYIILINWNGYKDTINCIKSLKKSDYHNLRIIIVDNGSTDDSISQLKKNFDGHIIASPINMGFSGGANLGIKYALKHNADYVLLLNNDTIVSENLLLNLISVVQSDSNVGVVSPLVLYANDKEVVWSSGAIENIKSKFGYIDLFYKKNINQVSKNLVSVDCVWGCCMLISNEVFNKIGYFDESYFLYHEDVDFCYRAKSKGLKIVCNPCGLVWHKVSGSSDGEEGCVKNYYDTRNQILFARKNLPADKKYKLFFFLLIDRILLITKNVGMKRIRVAKAILKGLIHGYSGKSGYYEFSDLR